MENTANFVLMSLATPSLNNTQRFHCHSVSLKDNHTCRVRSLNSNNCFTISDSTRRVYRRKLQKMLDQSENTATEEIVMTSNDTEIQEQEFSDNDGRTRSKVIDTQHSGYSYGALLIQPFLLFFRNRSERSVHECY